MQGDGSSHHPDATLDAAASTCLAQGFLPSGRDVVVDVHGLRACFLPVPAERWNDDVVFGFVADYCGPRGRAPVSTGLQLVWADDRGRFPWHDDVEAKVRRRQPVLADGDRIASRGGFHPDCAHCQAERAARRRRARAQARKRRQARRRRRRG